MVRLSNYFLKSIFLCSIITLLLSCTDQSPDIIFKREYTDLEKEELYEYLLNSAGTDRYYQGSVSERMVILEGAKYKKEDAWVARELGVPYLKRGFPAEAFKYYNQASQRDSEEWLGYQAYCWLYFYRDYERALKWIDEYDALTPNFVDYPQSTSVDYMRGICHLQMGNTEKAITSFTKHLNTEIDAVGAGYIEAMPYQLLAIAHHRNEDYLKAEEVFNEGIKHNSSTADLYYYNAINLIKLGKKEEAKDNLEIAQKWLDKGSKNQRNYVEEFYAIYKEDLDQLRLQFDNTEWKN